MELQIIKEGDNVIIIDAPTWKSLIGKSATVIKNDANPNFGDGHKKVKVDYEDGAVGWFWPHQLKLDNDINTIKDIVRHLKSALIDNSDNSVIFERKHIESMKNILALRANIK